VRRDCLSPWAGGGVGVYRQRHLVIKSYNEEFLDNLRVIRGSTPIETCVGRSRDIHHRASKEYNSRSETFVDKDSHSQVTIYLDGSCPMAVGLTLSERGTFCGPCPPAKEKVSRMCWSRDWSSARISVCGCGTVGSPGLPCVHVVRGRGGSWC